MIKHILVCAYIIYLFFCPLIIQGNINEHSWCSLVQHPESIVSSCLPPSNSIMHLVFSVMLKGTLTNLGKFHFFLSFLFLSLLLLLTHTLDQHQPRDSHKQPSRREHMNKQLVWRGSMVITANVEPISVFTLYGKHVESFIYYWCFFVEPLKQR